MKPFVGLYIGLGLVFGFLFLGIVAELYYLLWWKKKINSTEVEDDYNSHVKEPLHLTSSKRISTSETRESSRDPVENLHETDLELGHGKELGEEEEEEEDEELDLTSLYNLAGQPRFLFTIKEETKEDLESEDGKSKDERSRKGSRTRSLSDIITTIETPFFTPMASPPLKPSNFDSLDSYKHHGFNPLFESAASSVELELNRLGSSPPPKFKFLRDAEEKLYRRLMEEAQKRGSSLTPSRSSVQSSDFKSMAGEEERNREGSVNLKNEQRKPFNQRFHYSSSSSQVLPLVSSPEFQTLDKKVKGFC